MGKEFLIFIVSLVEIILFCLFLFIVSKIYFVKKYSNSRTVADNLYYLNCVLTLENKLIEIESFSPLFKDVGIDILFPYNKIRIEDFLTNIISENANEIKSDFYNILDGNFKNIVFNKRKILLFVNNSEYIFDFWFLPIRRNNNDKINFSMKLINCKDNAYFGQKNLYYIEKSRSNTQIFDTLDDEIITKNVALHFYNKKKDLLNNLEVISIKISRFSEIISAIGFYYANELKKSIIHLTNHYFGRNAICFYSTKVNHFVLYSREERSQIVYFKKFINYIKYRLLLNKLNKILEIYYPFTKLNLNLVIVKKIKKIDINKVHIINNYLKNIFLYPDKINQISIFTYSSLLTDYKNKYAKFVHNFNKKIINNITITKEFIPIINYTTNVIFGNIIYFKYIYKNIIIPNEKFIKRLVKDKINFSLEKYLKKSKFHDIKCDNLLFICVEFNLLAKNIEFAVNFFKLRKKYIPIIKNFDISFIEQLQEIAGVFSKNNIPYGILDYYHSNYIHFLESLNFKPSYMFLSRQNSNDSILDSKLYSVYSYFLKKCKQHNIEVIICGLKKVQNTLKFLHAGFDLFTLINKENNFQKPVTEISKEMIKKYMLDYNNKINRNVENE